MPPKKLKLSPGQTQLYYEMNPSLRPASWTQALSTESQDAADSLNDGPRSLQGMSTELP
ncbi:hypothetical protein GJ744_011132 [Endocarpon pusillum]|uniref:Uncharacterized protein n=1 Tax=Endocarpon pusillum TaxID=364733 RepID=A0A8H7E4Z2_9EURO|nr:hypothetical protein GJ744_011132 [Endocarpon pusillum]